MAVNVTGATGYVGARSIAATSTGRLWALTGNGTTLQMWYSDDNGVTWTRNTSADITTVQVTSSTFSLYIDADDHAHAVYNNVSGNTCTYARMASIGANTSWSATATVATIGSGTTLFPHIVAHREGTGWKAHVVYERADPGPTYTMSHVPITITSGNVITVGTELAVQAGNSGGNQPIGLDFYHTMADPKAVQSSTPHLFTAWISLGAPNVVWFCKATYSSGTWTWGTPRTILVTYNSAAGDQHSILFDGTRVVIAAQTSGFTPTVTLYERDAADTTTTTRTMTSMTILRPRALYNTATQDVFIIGEAAAGNSVDYKIYTRSTDTWGTQTAIEAEAVTHNTVAVPIGGLFVVPALWDGASSIRFEQTSIASPPTASTWAITDNIARDVGATLGLDWDFVDPLPGDTQGAYAMRRQIGAGTLYYWRASDSSWQTTEQKNSTATTSLALASGWGADGDANHKYSVKTWDAADTAGVYSAELTVIPSTPSNPTLSTPASAGTVTTATLTAAWTVTDQATYKVELLSAADVSLYDSGWVTSTSDRTKVVGYSLVNGVSYKCRLTTTNSEGLAAAAVTHSFTCTYTPPATPTVVVAANSTLGKITITPTQPTPSGGQPTVTSIDIYVRCAAGRTYASGERPVGGTGIRILAGSANVSTAWIDWACASGVAYEYMVRGWAADGTFSDSAWTA